MAEIKEGDDIRLAWQTRSLAGEEMDDELFIGREEPETRREVTHPDNLYQWRWKRKKKMRMIQELIWC